MAINGCIYSYVVLTAGGEHWLSCCDPSLPTENVPSGVLLTELIAWIRNPLKLPPVRVTVKINGAFK